MVTEHAGTTVGGRAGLETLVVRTLVDSRVPIAIFSWRNEPGWPVEFVSPNVEHVLGFTADDFVSGRVAYAKIVHPDDLARVTEEVAAGSAGESNAFEHQDYRVVDPTGSIRWVRDHTAVVRDAQGNITHYFGYILDSTARHLAQEAIEAARIQAESAARAKSEFLANVTHELRTPLTLIRGPVEALLAGDSGPLPEAARRHLERVGRNTERLYRLVTDILELAKLEAGRQSVQEGSVDLVAMAGELVEDAREAASAKAIELSFTSEGPGGGRAEPIIADPTMVERILVNLLGNALRFTERGRIEVGVRFLAEVVELSVSDTGPGIAEEDRARIFQRFEQVDASTTRRHEGTGLGLALVKSLTELLHGTVSLESTVGLGSRFTVRLPRRPASSTAASSRTADSRRASRPTPDWIASARPTFPAPTGVDRPRVLVADDNADMRAFIVDVLEPQFEVETAADGLAALELARATMPAVIVCDVMMPELDGLSVARRIKEDPTLRAIPVILVTANAGRDALVSGLAAGADDYLVKPFHPTELRARIDAAERLHGIYLELAARHRDLALAHQRLKTTQEQLVQAGKLAAVGTLTAGISHELNNPMATIVLQTERLLRQTERDSPQRASLEAIERQARRCRDLVRVLLDISRVKPSMGERVKPAALLEDVALLAKSQARGRDVDVESSTEPGVLPEVIGSMQELETAVLNLVSNALDASPPGGRVLLRARPLSREERPGVEIAVTDTGPGISDDVLPHVFDPFFTTKAQGKGTGLGLALAQRVVDASGGYIDVETGIGRGTTMRIWLPAFLGEPLS